MANYINLETKQVSTEHEIRSAHHNTSFATPFSPDGYAVVFDVPQPTYDKYSETVQQGLPVLTSKGHWEQTWSIIQLEGDQLTAAQAQKVEDEKAKIKADIAARFGRELMPKPDPALATAVPAGLFKPVASEAADTPAQE